MESDKKIVLPDTNTLKAIQNNVELVKSSMKKELDVELDLDAKSIEWIDGYINRNSEAFEDSTKRNLVSVLGSFLGEAIIKNIGGKWALNNESLGIHLKGKSWAFPFSKVEKQLYDGPEDSIYSFYRVIPKILDGSLS